MRAFVDYGDVYKLGGLLIDVLLADFEGDGGLDTPWEIAVLVCLVPPRDGAICSVDHGKSQRTRTRTG